MATISILPATVEDGLEALRNLREEDAKEMFALGRAEWLVPKLIAKSDASFCGRVDGEIACVWGIVNEGFVSPAKVWMLTTPLVERAWVRFIRESRDFIAWGLARYGTLGGEVVCSNAKSERWLRWLGFEVLGEPVETAVGPAKFFEKRLF